MHKFILSFLILLALCFSSASAQDKKQALQSFFTRIQFPDSNAKEFDRVELLQLYNSVSQKNYSTKKQECDNILDLYKQKLLNQSGNVALAKKYKSLLQSVNPKEMRLQDISHRAWQLVASGYTLENINELYTKTGINALDIINYDYSTLAEYQVLTNSLIVIGTIDSIFVGDFNDLHRVSYSVSISKVLKGNKNLKHIIIRTDNEELAISGTGDKYTTPLGCQYIPAHLEKLVIGQEYLLCLSKLWYERKVTQLQLASEEGKQEYQFRNDKITQEKRSLCYDRGASLQLNQNSNEQSTYAIIHPKEKSNKLIIQEIQDLCKKLNGFFEKMNKENILPNQH